MKKIILFCTVFFALSVIGSKAAKIVSPTSSSEYFVNDDHIEMMFTNSTDISSEALQPSSENLLTKSEGQNANAPYYSSSHSGKSAIAAIVIDFFLGGLGIHRIYLGTATFTWVGYILTCGGIFGIVPFVDLIVLAVNAGDISKFEDNTKFFMW
jgi:TM2 domain-containing membrane protein YozV